MKEVRALPKQLFRESIDSSKFLQYVRHGIGSRHSKRNIKINPVLESGNESILICYRKKTERDKHIVLLKDIGAVSNQVCQPYLKRTLAGDTSHVR